MKVLSVSNYFQNNYFSKNEKRNCTYDNSNTPFKGWNVNVLELSEDSLTTAAKHFYKSTDEELKEVTTEKFIGIKQKNKSLAAYYKLKNAVEKAKLNVASIQSMIQMIKSKINKNKTDMNSLVMLQEQLQEYEVAFENRKEKYYSYPYSSSFSDDLDYQIQLAKSDGSWYDY